MENKPDIKITLPAAEPMSTPDPLAPAETNVDISQEIDADDAVHSKKEKVSEENKQQDADDAVHKNYKPAPDSSHENDERDPDDAVHGR